MANLDLIQMMKLRAKTQDEFNFDQLTIPHWTHYLSPMDVDQLRRIATSKRLSGQMNEKLNRIKMIMNARGFVRMAGGTNRVVYRHLEDTRFVAKVAIDSVGMSDNPAEWENQWKIRPFCTKMFQVTDCGTVGFAERVLPITSKQEYKTSAEDIFGILYSKIIGKYIVEDVGTEYFMNFGLRANFGPVLLDYPYLFDLEGAKLICQNILLDGSVCGGEIDYDDGLNNILCTRCRKKYLAKELQKDKKFNRVIIKRGGTPMNVRIRRGNEVIGQNYSSNFIKKPEPKKEDPVVYSRVQARITKNGKTLRKGDKPEDFELTWQQRLAEIKQQIEENSKAEEAYVEVVKTATLNTEIPEEVEAAEKAITDADAIEKSRKIYEEQILTGNVNLADTCKNSDNSEGYNQPKSDLIDFKNHEFTDRKIVYATTAKPNSTRKSFGIKSSFIPTEGEY